MGKRVKVAAAVAAGVALGVVVVRRARQGLDPATAGLVRGGIDRAKRSAAYTGAAARSTSTRLLSTVRRNRTTAATTAEASATPPVSATDD